MAKARFPKGTRVQSLVFDRKRFSASAARSWAATHGFKAPATDPKPTTLRLRQAPPSNFAKTTFRTKAIAKGVKIVTASPKKKK